MYFAHSKGHIVYCTVFLFFIIIFYYYFKAPCNLVLKGVIEKKLCLYHLVSHI